MGSGKDLLRVKQAVRANRDVGTTCYCGEYTPSGLMCSGCEAKLTRQLTTSLGHERTRRARRKR